MLTARRALLALSLAAGCGSRTGLEALAPDGGGPDAAPDVAEDVAEEPPGVDRVEPELPAPDAAAPDAAPDVAAPVCGDGRVDPGEACDLGAANALVPAFRLSPGARPTVAVEPLARPMGAVSFYRYESASAHTGFEAVGVSNAFLYVDRGDNALSLFFFAGRDDDGAAPAQPEGDMEVWFRGVPAEAQVALSDDAAELARQPSGDVRGRWSFNANTDGGVLTRLPWDRAWRVVVEPTYRAGVTAARYLHRDGRAVALVPRDAFALEHFAAPSRCRPDCQVPRCGDGHVDGGERCDDGNTRGGDGCGATCQRIE